jgi:hypothetical protein
MTIGDTTMKNLLAYTPEPFENLEIMDAEYDVLAGEGEMEDEVVRQRRARNIRKPAVAKMRRVPMLSKKVKPTTSFRPRVPLRPLMPVIPVPFAPPRSGAAAAVNVFPPADNRRPSGQSSSSGSAAGQDSSGNAPMQDVSSEHVRWVQETLNRALGLRLLVDGIMNRETRSAVRMFQERKGLPITGQAAAEPELLEGEVKEFAFEAEPFGN